MVSSDTSSNDMNDSLYIISQSSSFIVTQRRGGVNVMERTDERNGRECPNSVRGEAFDPDVYP